MSDDYVPIAKLVRKVLGKPDKPSASGVPDKPAPVADGLTLVKDALRGRIKTPAPPKPSEDAEPASGEILTREEVQDLAYSMTVVDQSINVGKLLRNDAALRARADAAEREVERLRTGHPPDEAEARTRKELQDLLRDMGEVAATQTARAEKAERERDEAKGASRDWMNRAATEARRADAAEREVDRLKAEEPRGTSAALGQAQARADRLAEALREIGRLGDPIADAAFAIERWAEFDEPYSARAARAALKREEEK